MSSYVRYLHNERIIVYVIVERNSNKQTKAADNNVRDFPPSIECHSERGANAGSWTSVHTMKQMSYYPYANCLVGIESCVFERFVIFAIRKNWLANYVQIYDSSTN